MFDDGKIHIDFGKCGTGQDVKITCNGKNVFGVSRLEVDAEPNSKIKIRLTLTGVIMEDIKGIDSSFFVIDPIDGKFKEVESIKFKNNNV